MPECEDESEQLAVRDMWEDEARDFTPWLAKNLHLLGEVLEMKLKLVQMERLVGPYYLDILAKETDKGVKVAIENQLEETNLHHLGQLLTYATGCDAPIAIWVAPEFGYEHAQALHRLNKWTDDRIRFYGVKVEVVKTAGADSPETKFHKVVYPGGWNKEITLPVRADAPDHPAVLRLLPATCRCAASEIDFAAKAVNHYGRTGRRFPSRLNPGIFYAASIVGPNNAWVTLHIRNIRTDDIEQSNQIFDTLKGHREQIEKCLEAEWHWRSVGQVYVLQHKHKNGWLDRRST